MNRTSRNWLSMIIKKLDQELEGIREDHWRDLWLCETGAGQQEAHLHYSYVMKKEKEKKTEDEE